MIRRIYGRIKRHLFGLPPLAKIYPQHYIGRGTYGDAEILDWGEEANLTIGAYTSIANGVRIFLGGEHRTDWVTTYPFNVMWKSARKHLGHPYSKGRVVIGNDVWIGTGAMVLSGVTIGDGAVIGAGSVIAKDVAPYSIVCGNPQRFVRYRFPPDSIRRLQQLRWWDWSEERIADHMSLLLSDDIDSFLDVAERLPSQSN